MNFKPLAIQGIGVLTSRGRGLEKFEASLREGWKAPQTSPEGHKAYRLAPEDLMDRAVLQKARRADRFSRLVVLAAHDALRDAALTSEELLEPTGIIVATAFGAHSSIFRFLDDIIDYGETNVSPTIFAHSIHNAAAAYAASVLESKGPTMTVTRFHFALPEAFRLAYAWLSEGRVKRVLVGTADECSPAMEYICEEKLSEPADGKMRPFLCDERPLAVPGEGSVFFLLSGDAGKARYGFFSGLEMGRECRGWKEAELSILSAHAMAGSEQGYKTALEAGREAAAYSPLYGAIMSAGGLECAAAALMLKNQVLYASPVRETSSPWKVESETKSRKLGTIQCISHGCEGDYAFLKLTKP